MTEYIKKLLETDDVELKNSLTSFMKDYTRKSKRLDKTMKHSDKQQLMLFKMHETISAQKNELDKIHQYDTQQQVIAKEKLDLAIVDDLENHEDFKSTVIYKPADILSGDFYSTHILSDGSLFVYIIDGQGHGISPALTVFAVSSTISHLIEENISFEEIVNKLFPMIRKFLGEIEQLSFTMIGIDKKYIQYASGGMYPFMIKKEEEVITYKANNLPFMNFSPSPVIKSITIDNWSDMILYTDGLVEDLTEDMSEYSPLNLLARSDLFEEAKNKIANGIYEDDITVIKISR